MFNLEATMMKKFKEEMGKLPTLTELPEGASILIAVGNEVYRMSTDAFKSGGNV